MFHLQVSEEAEHGSSRHGVEAMATGVVMSNSRLDTIVEENINSTPVADRAHPGFSGLPASATVSLPAVQLARTLEPNSILEVPDANKTSSVALAPLKDQSSVVVGSTREVYESKAVEQSEFPTMWSHSVAEEQTQ